jgi:hypothetical protein
LGDSAIAVCKDKALTEFGHKHSDLILLVLGRMILQSAFTFLFGVGPVALLEQRHGKVIAIGRIARILGDQILEEADSIFTEILLDVDQAERVGDVGVLR